MVAHADETVSQRIAARLHEAANAPLPADVLAHARVLILDTRMVALAGAAQPDVVALRDLARRTGGAPQSRIWADGERIPAAEAAFLNALSASALDYDSLHENVHPDAIVLAAAWAAGESAGASGRQLIRAFVLGSELICRLAEAVQGPQKGWSIGPVLGPFGAAAAAALLLGLTPGQTAHALGLCLSMAAGSQQANVEQVLAKRLQPALAARAGVHAALLAQAGMTAPSQAFEGRFGLWTLYFPADRERLLQDFGRRFSLLQTGLKKYPVCACSHAALDALEEALRAAAAGPDDIERVEVVISPFMDRLVGRPFQPAGNPQVTAQFSLRYGLACIALRGRLGLAELADEAVLDPRIAAFVSRIEVVVDPRNTGELAPATVRLHLRSGACVARTVEEMPGGPQAPLSASVLRGKHVECATACVPPRPAEDVDGFGAWVAALERVDDLSAPAGEPGRGGPPA